VFLNQFSAFKCSKAFELFLIEVELPLSLRSQHRQLKEAQTYDGPQGTRCKQIRCAANKKGNLCEQKTNAANKKDALQPKNDR